MQIARFEAVARMEAELASQRGPSPEAPFASWFIAGDDQALAAAGPPGEAQGTGAGKRHRCRPGRDLKPRSIDGVTYVGVGLEMSGSAPAIRDFLAAIETRVPSSSSIKLRSTASFRPRPALRSDPSLCRG